MDRATVTSVSVRNFKSIGQADVNLSRLTVFVGHNGAGKCNFLQAIQFLADAVASENLHTALGRAQGLFSIIPVTSKIVGRRWPDVSVGVEIHFSSGAKAKYQLIVGSNDQDAPILRHEHALVTEADGRTHKFSATEGRIEPQSSELHFLESASGPDRMLLPVAMTVNRGFRRIADALGGFATYDYRLDKLNASQIVPEGQRAALNEDCSNLPMCLWHLKQHDPQRFARINAYLARMLEGVTADVQKSHLGVSLSFPTKVVEGFGKFPVAPYLVSDGTLRMTAALTALFQSSTRNGMLSVIGIEEPEAAVHPGVLPILVDAMIEASEFRQILVTTHSPDLIDHDGLSADNIRFVDRRGGTTSISPIDDVSKEAVQERLYTLGQLLRLNQLSGAATRQGQ